MTSRDFCYWLQGFFEIDGVRAGLSVEQADCVKNHLAMVFKHEIDPSFDDKKLQDALSKLHKKPDGDLILRC